MFVLTLLCFFLISISAAGVSINFKTDGDTVKNKIHSKIESGLLEEEHAPEKQSAFIAQIQNQNSIKVVFEMSDNDKGYIKSLENNGATIEAVHENLVQASVPVSQVQRMSELPFVNYIRSPRTPFKDAVVSSEGVAVINATPLNNLGVRGQGVRIAIIDVGFAGYKEKLGSELPSSVITKSITGDINGSQTHGTAVAEIIHDIAPDAQLYLIKIESDVEFFNAVDYALSQGVDIISMSLGWLDVGPFDGTSAISEKVNSTVSGGIVWVNSAGNYAQKHWKGKFNDTDGNGINNFIDDNENMSINLPPGSGSIWIFLSWDDWAASNQDYDLYLYDSAGGEIASSINDQSGQPGQKPTESISINLEEGIYNLQIRKNSASREANFELFSYYQDLEPQYRVPSSSLSIPADAEGAITVGATNYSNDVLEPSSSQGPTIDGRIKPDLVAPDGVSTSTYLTFTGTSASAPHVAGAAALLKSINLSLTPADIRYALENTAKDLGDDGKDNSYGSGRIDTWKAAIIVDENPPEITITSPAQGTNLNSYVIAVSGTASDNAGVSTVEVRVGNGSWQTAHGTTSWNGSVTLSEGQNTISARAVDIAGNIQNTSVTVNVPPAQGKPAIISWNNGKTNDISLALTINTSENVKFNATANQTITTWNWFIDGENQNHNFDDFIASWSTAGIRAITVNATNSNGTSDTITWFVTVNAPPAQGKPSIISWNNDKTNDDSLILTINTSENVKFNVTANQTITTWNWLKDGVIQDNNFDNFVTSWSTTGTKILKANATNSNGTSNTITWIVTVNAPPAQGKPSIITWNNDKTDDISQSLTLNTSEYVKFNATANQTITTWNWFKDGENQNNNFDDFIASWSTAGTKTVKVNATNSNGTSDTIAWFVTVNVPPAQRKPAIISWINNKTNDNSQSLTINTSENVKFNAIANQTITIWNWFIDGENQDQNNFNEFTASWSTAGTKTVKVNATNSNGTSNTITWIVTVNAPPAQGKPSIITWNNDKTDDISQSLTLNTSENVRFNATANQTITTWNWLKDGENQNNNFDNFIASWSTAGIRTIKANATNSNGTSDTITWTVTVNEPAPLIITITLDINTSTFIVNSTGIITTPGGNVTITVPKGTNASLNGSYLPSISIDSLAEVNATFIAKLGSDRLIGENLSLGPAGAIFSPDIQIRFNYTHSQLTAAGIAESELAVKFYNTSAGAWESLAIYERNTTADYIIANASHFSTFALIGVQTTTAIPYSSGGGSSGSSSGGGGGGGGASGENYSNIVIKEQYDKFIYKDKLTSYAFTHKLNPILYVNVTGNTNAGETSAVVEVLRNTSSLLKSPASGKVYQNMNTWLGTSGFATAKNIKEVRIRFRVDNAWIDSNGLDANDISMVRWDGTKWTALETKVLDKDGTNTYFESDIIGFSHFAITGLKEVQPAVDVNGTSRWNILRPEPTGATGSTAFGVAPSINLILIMGILIVLIIAVLYLKDGYIRR